MMKIPSKLIPISAVLLALSLCGCADMMTALNTVTPFLANSSANSSSLSNTDVVNGLKQALSIGATNSASYLSNKNGFYSNPKVKIPFPSEVQKVEQKLRAIGLDKPVDSFILTLNRAAETAAKEAAPVFISAIKQMSIKDGFTILTGGDNAATQYLQSKTNNQLKTSFSPIVARAIQKTELTKYWNPVMTTYNNLPFLSSAVNPDLEAYVTQKAIEGLFVMVAQEEKKIRDNPASRTTDLLQRVFAK